MHLLVCVINEEEKLNDILSGFVELGVTGATVIRSEGMGHVLAEEAPVFAGLQSLVSRTRPQNSTIFSVIESDGTLDAAIDMIQEVCGGLHKPATGILFTLPVDRVIGLAPELGSGTS